MAIVRHLELLALQVEARHSEVKATYSVVKDKEGVPHLQLDTYGSASRSCKVRRASL